MNRLELQPLIVALVAAMTVAPTLVKAEPQAARAAEERRLQQERERQQRTTTVAQAEGQEAKYPQATRPEPEGRASAKRTPQLKELFDAYNTKDFTSVLRLADALLADPESNPYERASAARLAGASQLNVDNKKAAAYVQTALETDGLSNNEHYEAMYLLAQLQLQGQQYAESLATVDRFLSETKTQAPDTLVLKGNALYRLQRYPEAVAVLQQAVDGSGGTPDPAWVQLLAASYSSMGKPDEATKLFERVGGAAGDDTQSQLNLAATYMQAGQDAKAAEILERLRANGQLSNEQDYRNLYAIYSNTEGRQQDAIKVINEGLQKSILKPDYQNYVALAQAYWFSDQPGKAIEAYQKAAPLAPDGETYLNLARALTNEGRGAEAKEAAKQALAKGVKKPEDANRIIGNK